jgi:hypothetical protein
MWYRFKIRLVQWRRKVLMLASPSYRQHDQVVAERNDLRSQLARAGAELKLEFDAHVVLEKDLAALGLRLELAEQSLHSAEGQLIAERELRQAADLRSQDYHNQLTESLKTAANYCSKMFSRKAMFGDVEFPEPPEENKPIAIHPKPLARQVAQDISDITLRKLYEEIKQSGPIQGGAA